MRVNVAGICYNGVEVNPMDIKLGKHYRFNVKEIRPDSYVVARHDAVFELPKSAASEALEVGDIIEGFVYVNQAKKLVVTTKRPFIDAVRPGLVEVVEEKPGLGVFVNIGLDKDMLVSKDDLPFIKKHWPQKGDQLFCYLKGGRNQIIARLVGRYKMAELFKPETPLEAGETITAYVGLIGEEGLVLFTKEGHEVFVYFKHAREEHRLGEVVSVAITHVKDQRHANGRLTAQKETMLDSDAERILEALKNAGGKMALSDKSSPEAIFSALHMSKAAFKRALGHLYKQGLVRLETGETVLIQKD
ncbi:MAG: hypothetical protein EA374_08590 [Acholeplasmatales bacterium]|nr:MAG: hypothetical protein EA374_08590 [Acholeplasmatales bacterium]